MLEDLCNRDVKLLFSVSKVILAEGAKYIHIWGRNIGVNKNGFSGASSTLYFAVVAPYPWLHSLLFQLPGVYHGPKILKGKVQK